MKRKRIRKRKMKALKVNFLARLRPAKLSTNRGSFDRTKSPKNRSARRKGPRICHRNFIPQKVMDYYGIPNQIEADMWEIHHDWSRYVGSIKIGPFQWETINYKPKAKKSDRHRRHVRNFVKKYDLEHRLLYT